MPAAHCLLLIVLSFLGPCRVGALKCTCREGSKVPEPILHQPGHVHSDCIAELPGSPGLSSLERQTVIQDVGRAGAAARAGVPEVLLRHRHLVQPHGQSPDGALAGQRPVGVERPALHGQLPRGGRSQLCRPARYGPVLPCPRRPSHRPACNHSDSVLLGILCWRSMCSALFMCALELSLCTVSAASAAVHLAVHNFWCCSQAWSF